VGAGVDNGLWLQGNGISFSSHPNGSEKWNMPNSGHFFAAADNTYDIGAVGASRPRTTYLGTSLVTPKINVTGGISATAWTTTGIAFDVAAATFTDTSTAGAGTVAVRTASSFSAPTFASTNAITVTDAFTLYVPKPIAGTNTTITRANSAYFEGAVGIGTTTLAHKFVTVGNIAAYSGSVTTNLTSLLTASGSGAGQLFLYYDGATTVKISSGIAAGDTYFSESNVIIGATAAGATAAKNLVLTNSATAPTTTADLIHLYGADISAGNAALAVYTEAALITTVDQTTNRKVPFIYNGVTVYLMATTSSA